MNKEHKDLDVINLDAPRLAWYKQKVWKKHQNTVYWVDINLVTRKDLSSIKHDRTHLSFTTHSQLIVSRRLSWWDLEKSYARKYMRHLDLHRRFPLKTIGWKNWVQKFLEVVFTPNKPKQRPKIQLFDQGDLFCQSNNLVRVFRKSRLFLTWLRKHRWKNRETCFPVVCQCLLNV